MMKKIKLILKILFFVLLIVAVTKYFVTKEERLFEDTLEYGSISSYENYLNEYPQGKYAQSVSNELFSKIKAKCSNEEIYRYAQKTPFWDLEKKLKDYIYNSTAKENTLESWTYYKTIVDSDDIRDANERIDSIESVDWGTEARAWETASSISNLESYKRYLELYPNGRHSKRAKKNIIDCTVERDFQGEHGDLPSMNQTAYGNGSTTRITVYNNTAYELTLMYSSKNYSKEVIISSNRTKTISMQSGFYRISARVNTSGVLPFVGSETLSGGSYDVEYYIVTSRY